jgi:ankyrin repeat protein
MMPANAVVDRFLELGCADPILANGPAAHAERQHAAMRILNRHSDLARANLHTAVVCGDLEEVNRILKERPDAPAEPGGPLRRRDNPDRQKQWTPLLHLCYAAASCRRERECGCDCWRAARSRRQRERLLRRWIAPVSLHGVVRRRRRGRRRRAAASSSRGARVPVDGARRGAVLDLGTPLEIEDDTKQRPLHAAAEADALQVARLLVERGADTEAVETQWNNTSLDHAMYGNLTRMMEFLGKFTRDVFRLTHIGSIDRLREVLEADPSQAKRIDGTFTPLMWLPDDESRAVEAEQLLLSHGADPSVKSNEGKTAADYAYEIGLYAAADLLRAHRLT